MRMVTVLVMTTSTQLLSPPLTPWEGEISHYPIPDGETEARRGEEITTIARAAIIKVTTLVINLHV